MKRLIPALLALVLIPSARADLLGGFFEITPLSGWESVEPREQGAPPSPAPTVKFIPQDGHRAALMVTLLPAHGAGFEVTDLASLKQFNRISATPYLATPDARPAVTEIKVPGGLGVYVVNEDPSLAGKPTPPGEFRTAITMSILRENSFLLHCTIFLEKADSEDFRQAMKMVTSATIKPRDNDAVSRAGLSAVLHLPPKRFEPSGSALNQNPGYFIFADGRGVILSGWLEPAEKFKDMTSFWAKEKAHLVQQGGFTIASERSKTINGWSAILYVAKLEQVSQTSIRACRVVGDTWVDLHLSMTGPTASWKELESVLAETSLTTD